MSRQHLFPAMCAAILVACSGPNSESAASTGPVIPETDAVPAGTLEIVRILAADEMGGRRTGTEGNAAARAWLVDQMAARGLQPFIENYAHDFTFQTVRGETLTGINLIAHIDGQSDQDWPVLVVTAHYDHVGMRGADIYNGADDNASGVAGALAIADHFLAEPPENDVIIALLDAEEIGLQGAKAFMSDARVQRGDIGLNINLDMLSKNDRNELYAAGAYHRPELAPLLEEIAASAPITLKLGHDDPSLGPDDWTQQSDHALFHRAGIPFVYFGVEDHPDYHQPTDVFETIPQDFFLGSVETVVMAADRLDEALTTLAPAE